MTQEGKYRTDAEDETLSVGSEHSIRYASRVLTFAEIDYNVTKEECLAVSCAVEEFLIYMMVVYFR